MKELRGFICRFLGKACDAMDSILDSLEQSGATVIKKAKNVAVPIQIKIPEILSHISKYTFSSIVVQSTEISNLILCANIVDPELENFSLLIELEASVPKLFFYSASSITSLLKKRHLLIGGTKEGSLAIWDLKEQESLHKSIQGIGSLEKFKAKLPEKTRNEIVLRAPSFISEFVTNEDKCENGSIKAIITNPEKKGVNEIYTIDEFGTLII